MSIVMLMASASGEPEPPAGWPETDDSVLAALRPLRGRVLGSGVVSDTAERDVESARLLGLVGPGRPGFLYWDYAGPDYRTELFLRPATYAGGGNSDWRAIVGTNPEQRSVVTSEIANGGVIHSFGSHYMENLHITPRSNADKSAPKYAWHITGGEMNIAANCTFDLSQIAADTITGNEGIAGWIGADGDAGMTILIYGGDFVSGPLMNTLNLHGPATGDLRLPMTTILVNCTGLEDVEVYCPGGVATEGGGSRLYVINTLVAGLGADAGCNVYTDSDAPAMGANAGTINRNVSQWPVPNGGVSDLWSDYYFPSAIGQGSRASTIEVADAVPFAPVPGRTYFTRVPLGEALCATHIGLNVSTVAGKVGLSMQPADSPYARDEPPSPDLLTPNKTMTLGDFAVEHYYAYSRYPGDNGIWHKMAFDASEVRVLGSRTLAGLTDCYYTDDGVNLVPVQAGTRHPVPFLAQDYNGSPVITPGVDPDPTVGFRAFDGISGPPGSNYDATNMVLGSEFRVTAPCQATEVHVWAADAGGWSEAFEVGIFEVVNAGAASNAGALLSQQMLSGLPVAGWNTVVLSQPVDVVPGKTYMAAFRTPNGRYCATAGYWRPGGEGADGRGSGPLVFPHAGDTYGPGQSRYHYGSGFTYPYESYQGANYWIDVTVVE